MTQQMNTAKKTQTNNTQLTQKTGYQPNTVSHFVSAALDTGGTMEILGRNPDEIRRRAIAENMQLIKAKIPTMVLCTPSQEKHYQDTGIPYHLLKDVETKAGESFPSHYLARHLSEILADDIMLEITNHKLKREIPDSITIDLLHLTHKEADEVREIISSIALSEVVCIVMLFRHRNHHPAVPRFWIDEQAANDPTGYIDTE